MNDMKSVRFPPAVADEMVRAILEGRKTVTRRVVKPQPQNDDCEHEMITFNDMLPQFYSGDYTCACRKCGYGVQPDGESVFRPPYRPGDILYVRETWEKAFGVYWYRADEDNPNEPGQIPGMVERTKWRPSIHMPREATRIFLRVTDVRVKQLQDMTPEQCIAEGVDDETALVRGTFNDLWDRSQPTMFL